jgi:5'-nucleotidase / UDP-sugar diphosphatase
MKTNPVKALSRRKFLVASAAVGGTFCLPNALSAAAFPKRTFTILHTNDLHSNLIGPSPEVDPIVRTTEHEN